METLGRLGWIVCIILSVCLTSAAFNEKSYRQKAEALEQESAALVVKQQQERQQFLETLLQEKAAHVKDLSEYRELLDRAIKTLEIATDALLDQQMKKLLKDADETILKDMRRNTRAAP